MQVEPAQRAYKAFNVQSVITGRRASQGGARASLQPLEVDKTGLLKLNPLFAWNFSLVEWYIKSNNVPRNKLLDQGYRSVGDWHSTSKVAEGQDERAGRWAGKEKTECGLHEDYFKMKAKAKARKEKDEDQAKLESPVIGTYYVTCRCYELAMSIKSDENMCLCVDTSASVGVKA